MGGCVVRAVKRPARHQTIASLGILRDARRPAFHGHAHEVAVLAQHFGVGRELGGEIRNVVAGGLQLPGVASGQDAGTRRSALGIWCVGAGKQQSFAGHAIESGRANPRTTIGAHVRIRSVVGNGQQDVGPLGSRRMPAARVGRAGS